MSKHKFSLLGIPTAAMLVMSLSAMANQGIPSIPHYDYDYSDYYTPQIDYAAINASIRKSVQEALRELREEEFGDNLDAVHVEKLETYDSLAELGVPVKPEDIMPSMKELTVEGVIQEALKDQDTAEKTVSEALMDYLQMTTSGKTPSETLEEYIEKVTNPKKLPSAKPVTSESGDSPKLLGLTKEALEVEYKEQTQVKVKQTDEELTESVKEIFQGKSEAVEDKLLEVTLQSIQDNFEELLLEGNLASDKLIEYMDKSGIASDTLQAARDIRQMKDVSEKTRELYEKEGRDVALGYLIFECSAMTADKVGGLYGVIIKPYAKIAGKMVETGTNVITSAEFKSGYQKTGTNIGNANKFLNRYGRDKKGGKALDVEFEGVDDTLEIAFWKKLDINGQEGWVAYGDDFEPHPYVFLTRPASFFSLFKNPDMEVYTADVSNADDGKIVIGDRGKINK